ncbi:purine and uridine phosphorylase, partial [Aureobasidium melanogenum]
MSDPQQYTVGWICAITTEYTAARQFLDKEHDLPTHVSANDINGYTLGEMAGHNVVIAVLPHGKYGLCSATSVAANMLNSFPNIRVGLMVGIGGGAPTAKRDIRFGDVVVSSPENHTGGVYQYDFGKTIQGREFQQTGFLNEPPAVVLTAVSVLKSTYESEGHDIEDRINAILEKKPILRKKYSRPAQGTDRLYKSTIVHPHGSEGDCRQLCGGQPHVMVQRPKREDENDPSIHYGIIASANQLMKDATIRDTLAKEKGILCFEMEAAGLMNGFPCLVVRGICDYSDSHKNKDWQGYAAMTAAAYAKNLLTRMVPSRVEQEDRIRMVLAELNGDFKELLRESKISTDVLKEHVHSTREHLKNEEARYLNKEHSNCHQVFKTSTYEQFKNINPDRVDQTCQWALSHPLYRRWRDSATDDLLWISADPGCGKSVLSKSLVDQELPNDANDSTVCYFFFKDNEEQNSLATALCALLHQLFQQQPHLLQHAVPAWDKDGSKLQQETDELWRILLAATSDAVARNTTCVLDALDECRDRDRGDLIAKLARFHADAASRGPRQSWLKLIVTSRPYDDIQRGFEQIPASLPAIGLRGEQENDQIHAEINRVIHVRVSQLAKELGLRESTSVRIEQTLLAMKHRTYLWLHLAIDDIRKTLQGSFRPDEEPVKSVPSSVEHAYEKILARVAPEQHQSVRLILQIIVGARRPLAMGEMALALGLATSDQHRTSVGAQVDPDHLGKQLRHWCGLFVFVNHSRIYLIHQTAREFLVAHQDYEHSKGIAYNTWKHCVQQAEMEQTMTTICIRCLNLEDRGVSPSDELSTDVLEAGQSRKEFVEYCCEWWTTHYRLSQDTSGEDTFQDVLALYNTEGEMFKFWFDQFWNRTWQHDRGTSMTPIRLAALSNHNRVLKHYLDTVGVHVDQSDEDGRTALYWASELSHDKTVQMLLDSGADVNAVGGLYGNALLAASYKGCDKIVQMLLDRGADVNVQDGRYGNALQAASAEGFDKTVHMLLDSGADVNAGGGQYGGALQAASYRGYDKVVQMLLDRGTDVNTQGGHYGNALQAASRGGHEKMVQMLLDSGADVNARGGEYGTALQAASYEGYDKIVQVLLDSGIDVNSQSEEYGSALQAASAEDHDKIVQMLLFHGVQADALDNQGRTALHLAARGGHVELFQYLLAQGADPKQQDVRGDTLLSYAAAGASLKMVEEVLSLNAPQAKESLWSPLHWACRKGSVELANLLLARGVEERCVEIKTIPSQWTPYMIAYLHRNEQLVSLTEVSNQSSPLSRDIPPGHACLANAKWHGGYYCNGCQQVDVSDS